MNIVHFLAHFLKIKKSRTVGLKLFVIIMPFEALGGVQVRDIAVCWSILISLSVKAYMLWLFFEGIVLGEVKVTGF